MERHILFDLERVALAVVGRRRNGAFTNVALESRRRLRIVRIDPHQETVERTDRMDHTERRFACDRQMTESYCRRRD